MTFSHNVTEHSNAPVVALHSSASNSGQWNQLKSDLEARFDVFAYDLPGYGSAALIRDDTQTGAATSAVPVIAEIEKFARPVHLVGHSNGGAVAIKVALMRPDLVKSLTLFEPAAFHILARGKQYETHLFQHIRQLSDAVTGAAVQGNAGAGMQEFLDFWNGAGFWNSLPASRQARFARLIPAVMADFANGLAETWELAELATLTMPCLVMTGLESPEVAHHTSLAIAKAIPGAHIALLPELGHMAPIFQPEWVNTRIFAHVASAERPVANCSWPNQEAA